MSYHTKTPWSINEWPQPAGVISIGAVGTPLIARVMDRDVSFNEHQANAKRIVACVNACDGIDDVYLNAPDNLATYARNMAIQRDELLDAIQHLLKDYERVKEVMIKEAGIGLIDVVAVNKAKQAIANAKGAKA